MSGRGRAADWEPPAPPASFRQTSRWQVSGGQRAICAARPPRLSGPGARESRAQTRGCPQPSASSSEAATGPGAATRCGFLGRGPHWPRGSAWTICPSSPLAGAASHVPGMPRMALEGCSRGHHLSPAPAPGFQPCVVGSILRFSLGGPREVRGHRTWCRRGKVAVQSPLGYRALGTQVSRGRGQRHS